MTRKPTLLLCLMRFLFLFSTTSCSLDNFSPAGTLNPSLILQLSNESSNLRVTFSAQNSQDYFLGYNIYLGADAREVRSRLYPVSNIYGSLPTLDPGNQSFTGSYTIIISNNTSGFLGGGSLSNSTVYVGVAAYGNDKGDLVYSDILVVSNILL